MQDPEYPATYEEVVKKFRANASKTIGSVKAERIIDIVKDIEHADNIYELVSCMY